MLARVSRAGWRLEQALSASASMLVTTITTVWGWVWAPLAGWRSHAGLKAAHLLRTPDEIGEAVCTLN